MFSMIMKKTPKEPLKNFKEKIWETKSESLKQLLKELLHKSPMKRISAQQALTHAWFKEASDSVKILMSKSKSN